MTKSGAPNVSKLSVVVSCRHKFNTTQVFTVEVSPNIKVNLSLLDFSQNLVNESISIHDKI